MVPNRQADQAITVVTAAAKTATNGSKSIAGSSLDDTVTIQNGKHSADPEEEQR